ncbi:cell wall-binding repeat-containing protein [Clostridium sp. JNZ X4-2]
MENDESGNFKKGAKDRVNKKKIVSLLLTLGILVTPIVAPQYTAVGNLTNKVYAYDGSIQDGNKVQKEPLQTDTGLVGEGVTASARMSESSTYEELMASPYKVEMPADVLQPDGSGYIGLDMTKLNVDGKIYHYSWLNGELKEDKFVEVRKIYVAETGAIERIYSHCIFGGAEHSLIQYADAVPSATSDNELNPYLKRYTTNWGDLMNPKPFIDPNVGADNNGNYVNKGRSNAKLKPDANGYVVVYSDLLDTKGRTVHIGTTNEDSGFVHYGPITGDEPVNFSNATYDSSKYDDFGNRKDETTPTQPSDPTTPTNFKGINVSRLAGLDRKETAMKIADNYLGKNKANNIIVANGYNYADALAGAPLARQLKAPILLVGGYEDSQDVLNYIESHLAGNGKVTILGGSAVVPDSFKNWFIANGVSSSNITRYGGNDRYETASKIEGAITTPTTDPIFIASGENFPDALSASPIASSRGYRIFLTRDNEESSYLSDYLTKNKPSKVYILGGTGSVSTEQENNIASQVGNKNNIKRLGGTTRFDTSNSIAEEFKDGATNAIIVNGDDYPDAISGSIIADKTPSITLLTPSYNISGIETFLGNNVGIKDGLLLGGEKVLSESLESSLSK